MLLDDDTLRYVHRYVISADDFFVTVTSLFLQKPLPAALSK